MFLLFLDYIKFDYDFVYPFSTMGVESWISWIIWESLLDKVVEWIRGAILTFLRLVILPFLSASAYINRMQINFVLYESVLVEIVGPTSRLWTGRGGT